MSTQKTRRASGGKLTRFGLNPESGLKTDSDAPGLPSSSARHDEIYRDHEDLETQPWWSSSFFVSKPVLFGAWDGVYTSCLIHLFGTIIFLRSGWIVGNAGVVASVLIVVLSVLICTVAAAAGIGISERCKGGTIHFLISQVLGGQLGGAISVLYCFGQAVSCALHVMGFAETISAVFHYNDPWFERCIGVGLVLFLVFINIAGVKWVVRLQFLLLLVLLFAALDFAVGVCVQLDPEHGVLGLSLQNLEDNSEPSFESSKVNLFTVFGVFFPAVTGVFAGVNMNGDLYNPMKDIPKGTFAAIGTSLFLYLLFFIGLGATCDRQALLTDYMIARKVSAVGYFLFAGLYVSSLSSCLGHIYATPRIMQQMACENIIPGARTLSKGQGANKIPVYALIVFSMVTFAFIMIRKINILATIVTIPYLLTYASVEYAYFCLAMTFDIQTQREYKFLSSQSIAKGQKYTDYGALRKNDLDLLFPERMKNKSLTISKQSSSEQSEASSPVTSPDEHSSILSVNESVKSGDTDVTASPSKQQEPDIYPKPSVWYSVFTNRWIALMTAIIKIIIMFLVHWVYAIIAILSVAFFWFYIRQINPGVNPGISQFNLVSSIHRLLLRCVGKRSNEYEHIIVPSSNPSLQVTASQLTEDGTDFSTRERYHQATLASIQPVGPETSLRN